MCFLFVWGGYWNKAKDSQGHAVIKVCCCQGVLLSECVVVRVPISSQLQNYCPEELSTSDSLQLQTYIRMPI